MTARMWPVVFSSTLTAATAWAQVPAGTEFQVNTYTTRSQFVSSVAADGAGNFVVAWTSDGQDGSGDGPGESGVFGQRFAASGTRRGAEFTVASSFLTLHYPSVGAGAAGDFAVVWDRQTDGSGNGIFSRRYDGAGMPREPAYRVNTNVPSDQAAPVVASDAGGRLFAAWTSTGQDGDSHGVFAQHGRHLRFEPVRALRHPL
jgi:hypothetical protein